MLFFGGKAKKERRAQIERFKKMFKMQLPEFRRTALSQGKTLKTVYEEEHFFMKTRQTTNIITADRVGGGDRTRNIEIDDIKKRDESAETVFKEALEEFIKEVGEIVHPDPAMKTEVKATPEIQAEAAEQIKNAEERSRRQETQQEPHPPEKSDTREPAEQPKPAGGQNDIESGSNPPADKKEPE